MGVLQEILATKRRELDAWPHSHLPQPPSLRHVQLCRSPGRRLSLISEIKLRSPSAGPLSRTLSIEQRAAAYEEAGASMLSVLVDSQYFDGDYSHLGRARSASSLPILCKEFIVDPRQLEAARAFGADAALLIVRCLTPELLRLLVRTATELGLTALVEVHELGEVQVALDSGAEVIGVNARNLDTLELKPELAREVLTALPDTVTRIHLSGVSRVEHVHELLAGPADAALIGEALMRQDDPRPLLTKLVAAAH